MRYTGTGIYVGEIRGGGLTCGLLTKIYKLHEYDP